MTSSAKHARRSFLMSAGPKRLGKYELQEVLGRGGMAEVWKGFDPQLKRYVAIKFMHTNLRSDPDFMNRFLREGPLRLLSAPPPLSAADSSMPMVCPAGTMVSRCACRMCCHPRPATNT